MRDAYDRDRDTPEHKALSREIWGALLDAAGAGDLHVDVYAPCPYEKVIQPGPAANRKARRAAARRGRP